MLRITSKNKESGQVALIAILIIAAAVLVVSLAASSMGVNEMIMSDDEKQSEQALRIADACVDEAVLRLRRVYDGEEVSYTGGTLNFGSDSCTITVTAQGDNRIIDVTSTVGSEVNRKIRVVVQWSPSFTFINWQEQQ
jgi:uncharacterized protein YpmB